MSMQTEAHDVATPNALTREAKIAQRRLLLRTLRKHGWSLTETAKALGMVGKSQKPQAGNVTRLIDLFGLRGEYQAAKDSRHKPAIP